MDFSVMASFFRVNYTAETKGRFVAEQMGIKIMGSIGLLIASYQSENISADEVKKCIPHTEMCIHKF